MKRGVASVAISLMLTTAAFAAPPVLTSVDKSASTLIDTKTAEQLWKDNTSPKVARLYPPGRFRLVSEVGGGFNDAKTCVVTARAMLLPVQSRKLVYAPVKSALAFDAAPNLSQEQCSALAHTKLKEAIQSLSASLSAG